MKRIRSETDHLVACLRDRDDKLCSDAADTIEMMRAERLKLDRRIHNQRHACRLTWETIEMRNDWRIHTSAVRTKMLKHWSAAIRELSELKERLATGKGP